MSRLSKNILYNLIGHVLLLILGFISVREIFRQLGEDALGIIFFTTLINNILRLILQKGISSTIVREVSSSFGSNRNYTVMMTQTFSFLYLVIYLVLALLLYSMAPLFVKNWINLKSMDHTTAIAILRILGIASLVALPVSFYSSLLNGIQRMGYNNFIDVFTTALQQFGAILILHFNGALLTVVSWLAAGYYLRVALYFITASRFFRLSAMKPIFSFQTFKHSWSFMSRMIVISIISPIRTQIDKIILSKILPLGVLGYYTVAFNNIAKAQLLTRSIASAAYPTFAVMAQTGKMAGIKSQYNKLQDLICMVIVPIFAFIPFAMLPLFSFILNEAAARLLLFPATLLCLGFYFNGTLNIPHIVTMALGKPGILARQNFYSFFIVLPVSIPLIYFWGLPGAGLSWILDQFFVYLYFIPRFCSECLNMAVWDWYKHILRILILTMMTYGVAGIIVLSPQSYTLLSLALGYVIASIFFMTGAWFIIQTELKSLLIEKSRTVVSKLGFVTFA